MHRKSSLGNYGKGQERSENTVRVREKYHSLHRFSVMREGHCSILLQFLLEQGQFLLQMAKMKDCGLLEMVKKKLHIY